MRTENPIAYLNGQFLPFDEIRLSPMDRGFLFADGVYEVAPVYQGMPFRLEQHLRRLDNSLAGLRIKPEMDAEGFRGLLQELLQRNDAHNALLYLQVTRGASSIRDHPFPANSTPTVFAMCSPLKPQPATLGSKGAAAITREDIRWGACHIKSISLLPNVLARQEAAEEDAVEAILVRDGEVTEATASNVFAVRDNTLITPPKGANILPGITRDFVLELAARAQLPTAETTLTLEQLRTADEVWITSSSKEIWPVTSLDGEPVGSGVPGPQWRRLMTLFDSAKTQASGASQSDERNRASDISL
jgi:D-alanine transaminase